MYSFFGEIRNKLLLLFKALEKPLRKPLLNALARSILLAQGAYTVRLTSSHVKSIIQRSLIQALSSLNYLYLFYFVMIKENSFYEAMGNKSLVHLLFLLGLVVLTFLNLYSKRSSTDILKTPLFIWRGLLILIHLILPGRVGRENVSEFLARESHNSNLALRGSLNVLMTLDVHTLRVNEPLPQDKNYSQNMDESRLKWLQFKKEVMEEFKDLPSFVKTYLQNAQSLIRFIGAKAKLPDGRTDEYFVMFLLSIPKRKELSVDSLKAILQGATFNEGRADSMAFIQKYLKDAEAVSEAFSDYTEEDLRHLLTSRHTSAQYVSWLNLVLVKKEKTNPKEKFLIHIIDNEKRKLLNKELLELDGETAGPYRIKVLQSKRDYDQAKNKFHNCVRSYFEDSDQDVVTLYHEESPVLCVSFSQNFQLMQAKAPFNASPETAHVSYLKKKIVSIKKGLK